MNRIVKGFKLLRGFLKSRIRKTPFMLSHLITKRCNLSCPFCLWRGDSSGELSYDQIMEIYRKARGSGFELLIIWGGEPLLRIDIGEIIKGAKKLGFLTGIITNGELLLERYNELVPALDYLFISLDAPCEEHDRIRGCPGLFKKIDRAITYIKKDKNAPEVHLICVLSRDNLRFIEDMASYGSRRGVPIIFQALNEEDYSPDSRRPGRVGSIPEPFEERWAISKLIELKGRGFPIRNSHAYLQYLIDKRIFKCHYKKTVLRVDSGGEIFDCISGTPFGKALDMEFPSFFRSKTYRNFLRRAESCNKCRDAGVIELSLLWELNYPFWV